jgi:hypothetical protein
MTHIVQFRIGMAREALERDPHPQGSAQIIIFPGVRRERHAEPEAEDCDRGRPERDWLELSE